MNVLLEVVRNGINPSKGDPVQRICIGKVIRDEKKADIAAKVREVFRINPADKEAL